MSCSARSSLRAQSGRIWRALGRGGSPSPAALRRSARLAVARAPAAIPVVTAQHSAAEAFSRLSQPTLSAADPSPSSDAQPLRRLLQDAVVDAPSEGAEDADALITGFVAYNIDAQISAKLAASGSMNATELYATSFQGVCTSLCRPRRSSTSLDAGRRILELCDNCWCRQNRPCTVSPPYGVCMCVPACASRTLAGAC